MNTLLRITRPLRWSTPRRSAKLLMRFARAERASHYDMLAAANTAPDAERRALYLRHATDEARHALMFTLRAAELAPDVAADPRETFADFEHLYDLLGEKRFVAFVHHGEKRARTRLARFRDEQTDNKTRAMFDAILEDEARHEAYTADILTKLDAWGELGRARRWELGRAWLRVGGALSVLLFSISMRAVYLLAAPIALVLKWRRS